MNVLKIVIKPNVYNAISADVLKLYPVYIV